MGKVKKFSDIKSTTIRRYKTGFVWLDFAYGKSMYNGVEEYGLPYGKISIWGGSGGIGKTRTAIEIALSTNAQGYRVLFIQNEVTPEEFKGWVSRPPENDEFYVSNESHLDEQINSILEIKPQIVVVDSVNMLEGFRNPTQLRRIMDKYRETTKKVGCHVIFISHLNKNGELKGNNDLSYLGDIICSLESFSDKSKDIFDKEYCKIIDANPSCCNGKFVLTIGKNRHGSSGAYVIFVHTDIGVDYLASSEELEYKSNNRDYKVGKDIKGNSVHINKKESKKREEDRKAIHDLMKEFNMIFQQPIPQPIPQPIQQTKKTKQTLSEISQGPACKDLIKFITGKG